MPWETEAKCVDCHTFVAEVDTGTSLYRNGTGHGGLSCPACHGPAHAQVPSTKDSDNYQAVQYQAKAMPLGSCKVCHSSTKGGGLNGVVNAHGGGAADIVHGLSHRADHDHESRSISPTGSSSGAADGGTPGRRHALRDIRSTYVLRKRSASSARRKTGIRAFSR